MKTGYIAIVFVLFVIGFCIDSKSETNKTGESKSQAIEKIMKIREQSIKTRMIDYYTATEHIAAENAKETVSIKTGCVILGGRYLAAPYKVCFGERFISINDIAVEPRFSISGQLQSVEIPQAQRQECMDAELLAQKKESLYQETGDYSLVILKLVGYAKSLDSVKNVRVEGNVVKVTFASNGITNEVGYICRKMRETTSTSETEYLRKEYVDIICWLREAQCVFIPLKDSVRKESSNIADKINALLDNNKNRNVKLCEVRQDIVNISACFTNPISEDDAVIIIANWHRSDMPSK